MHEAVRVQRGGEQRRMKKEKRILPTAPMDSRRFACTAKMYLLLGLLGMVLCGRAGYVLGRETYLAKEEGEDSAPGAGEPFCRLAVHLSGQIHYADGTPAAGLKLELDGPSLSVVTDTKGGFLFPNLAPGTYAFTALRDDGTITAQGQLEICSEYGAEDLSVSLSEKNAYRLVLSPDIRFLEIMPRMDGGQWYIEEKQCTFATRGGMVVTPEGVFPAGENVVETPGGTLFLEEGTIISPGGERADPAYIILPGDEVKPK